MFTETTKHAGWFPALLMLSCSSLLLLRPDLTAAGLLNVGTRVEGHLWDKSQPSSKLKGSESRAVRADAT